MKRKKVLIIYATYGTGHKTVANYIYDYLVDKSYYDVKIMDILDYENSIGKISKKLFEKNFQYNKNGILFTLLYKFFNHRTTTVAYKQVTKSILHNKRLEDAIVGFNPDLIISSHFFGITISSIYKKRGLINSKMISIITDYCSHQLWEKDMDYIDSLIVGNKSMKKELIKKGIPKSKIYDYGIPISPSFSNTCEKENIKDKYHVNNGKKTILFFAGGSLGSQFSYNYLKKLLSCNFDCNIIFVCGYNKKLKMECENYISLNNYKNVVILGFSNEVNNLLNICDIVITKPGGISITECLEMKKPMLLISGAGGQEIGNTKFICSRGYGINCKNAKKLCIMVEKLLNDTKALSFFRKNLKLYKDNKSLDKIYKLSKELIK